MRMVVQQPSQRDEHVTGKCKTRTREWKNAEKKNVSCAQNCGLLSAVYTTHLLTTWTSSLVRSTKPIRPTSLNLYQNHIKMFLILRACVCVSTTPTFDRRNRIEWPNMRCGSELEGTEWMKVGQAFHHSNIFRSTPKIFFFRTKYCISVKKRRIFDAGKNDFRSRKSFLCGKNIFDANQSTIFGWEISQTQ